MLIERNIDRAWVLRTLADPERTRAAWRSLRAGYQRVACLSERIRRLAGVEDPMSDEDALHAIATAIVMGRAK